MCRSFECSEVTIFCAAQSMKNTAKFRQIKKRLDFMETFFVQQ